MNKFHQLSSNNGGTAAFADVEDKAGLTFESLRLKCWDKLNQVVEQYHHEVQPEDSAYKVGTALSRISASTFIQIDFELQVEAKKVQAQL